LKPETTHKFQYSVLSFRSAEGDIQMKAEVDFDVSWSGLPRWIITWRLYT